MEHFKTLLPHFCYNRKGKVVREFAFLQMNLKL